MMILDCEPHETSNTKVERKEDFIILFKLFGVLMSQARVMIDSPNHSASKNSFFPGSKAHLF